MARIAPLQLASGYFAAALHCGSFYHKRVRLRHAEFRAESYQCQTQKKGFSTAETLFTHHRATIFNEVAALSKRKPLSLTERLGYCRPRQHGRLQYFRSTTHLCPYLPFLRPFYAHVQDEPDRRVLRW